MSNGTYYGPDRSQETPSNIMLEKTFLASGYLTGVGFGVLFVVYLACMRILWRRKPQTGFTYFLMVYISLLTVMSLIWSATSMFGLQLVYIDNRNYPGGPFGYLTGPFAAHPVSGLSLASYVINNLMADGILLWRCKVVWSASLGRRAYGVIIIPFFAYLASFGLGIAYIVFTITPNGLYSERGNSVAVPFFAMSLALNILLTLMIVIRIGLYQRQGRQLFGPNYGQHYTSISTMFIESAALYSINAILLLGTFIPGHPINQIWLGLAPPVQGLSSLLIIYRVAEGRAWDSNTSHTRTGPLTSIAFSGSTLQGRSVKHDDTNSDTAFGIPLHSMAESENKGIHVSTTVSTSV